MASPSSSAPPPPWIILKRSFLVQHNAVEDPLDLSLELANPPQSSHLTEPTSVHLEPTRDGAANMYPAYVIAANEAGILLQVSPDPSISYSLNKSPSGILAVARGFLPNGGHGARTGTAVRLPDRAQPLQDCVSTVKGVGLLPVTGTGGAEYVVAELLVANSSYLTTFRSGTESDSSSWYEQPPLACPLVSGTREHWTPHDVIAHGGNLWWVDLSQGLLGCDLLEYTPQLHYVELPEMFSLKDRAEPLTELAWYRVVRVSDRRLRFVDVAQKRDNPPEKTLVAVWTLASDPFDKGDLSGKPRWELQAKTSLAKIWASDSYKASRMPEEVPLLAFVHPDKPDVVYFFLKEYFFAVDVRNSAIVDFTSGQCPPWAIYWCHYLPWVLPPSRPDALGDENQSSEELDSHDKKDDNQSSEELDSHDKKDVAPAS